TTSAGSAGGRNEARTRSTTSAAARGPTSARTSASSSDFHVSWVASPPPNSALIRSPNPGDATRLCAAERAMGDRRASPRLVSTTIAAITLRTMAAATANTISLMSLLLRRERGLPHAHGHLGKPLRDYRRGAVPAHRPAVEHVGDPH